MVEHLPASAGDTGDVSLVPESGRQKEMTAHASVLSCLENSMDRGAWRAIAHGVTKSQTGLSY